MSILLGTNCKQRTVYVRNLLIIDGYHNRYEKKVNNFLKYT